jgi:hypothetical protein
LQFPEEVLQRSEVAQIDYLRWRCQSHFRTTKGQCHLFGNIIGYEWVKAPGDIVVLDTHGQVEDVAEHETPPGHGSLAIGKKTIPASILSEGIR